MVTIMTNEKKTLFIIYSKIIKIKILKLAILFSFEKVKFLQSYMVFLYQTKVYPQVTTSRMNNMNVSILQNILVYKMWRSYLEGVWLWRISGGYFEGCLTVKN